MKRFGGGSSPKIFPCSTTLLSGFYGDMFQNPLNTGFSEQIDEKRAKGMGIGGFIMKPAGMKKMAQKVREVLDAQ